MSNLHGDIAAAASLDPEATQLLVALDEGISLDDAMGRVRDWAVDGNVDELISALGSTLGTESLNIRSLAARALGDLGDTRAAPRLAAMLVGDSNDECRMICADALGRIGDSNRVAGLTVALDDKAPFVRMHAARALSRLAGAEAIEPLAAALGDSSWKVRVWSAQAQALRELGATTALSVPWESHARERRPRARCLTRRALKCGAK